jgi:predicted DNA-binding transcriptional regulator AlpA
MYLTTADLMNRFQFSQMSLWRLRHDPEANFPKPILVGKSMRWRKQEVEAWEMRTFGATSILDTAVA